MLDIKFIRENKDIVQAGAKKKCVDINIGHLIALDDERLKTLKEVEDLRAEVNRVSNDIAHDQEPNLKIQLIKEMRAVKEEIKTKEEKLNKIIREWQTLMLQVPNVPDISVPEGKSDADNQEIKVWGDKPTFPFEVKDGLNLISKLDLADFERGTKVSGFRGYFLKRDGALLSFALWQFFLDNLVSKGFIPMIVPSLVKQTALVGTGYIPGGENDLYKNQDGDYFAGTGEVAMMAYYANEVLDKKKFPIKFAAFSSCFRREAGAHGKDIKGFFRVHEFYKLEQVVLCEANHEESVKLHEEITKNVEDLLVALNLPYRIVANCGGDLGLGQVKKYDIEVWAPSQNKYRETHSSSYFHDFQTRRLNIKYKDSNSKSKYAHSLNNTAIATPRIIEAILENYQQADGTVKIPEVLRKYMGDREFISENQGAQRL
ncbi:serine--tRNA ligase [Candidatus Nomurabacteria bacterium RIFCSPHIGHO2_01_FULL_38_19]|uniref:Serine--tRNA ligase n=1 Tax=Candidatus Nomurabacteria bacterium RIFCSPHIGHO2_01_FULL_38_19 TaxID=1801732 RepID=A0A1F6UUH0_9BACT|nr:MAG: serine--tRNA ligase [Candidatus Nomurabacteria bacterium RIFCSPHIGHO2_01_FULL_38_19]